jgi:signal transduction histidine kinase/ActR/RegA family two-component response regulator
MKISARPANTPAHPSINWLMGVAIACLLGVIGLEMVFDNLRAELRKKSANERARLFVGEEIVHGINVIEKDLYLMAASSNPAGLKRVNRSIEVRLTKLRGDLNVLKQGGTVRRQVLLNLEGHDEMVREATYAPDPEENRLVMELIEIGPLLDQIKDKTDELERLMVKGWDLQESDNQRGFFSLHDEIDAFLKRIPPYFSRLDENANRLFFDSSERLRELESELQIQENRLTRLEMAAIALVLVLAGLAGMLFLTRINQANRRLEAALEEMRAAKDAAESASRAKSEFVSRMSHELRTPLNAIIGFAELLEAETLSPSHKNYVNLINESGKHLLELINAVLDHAKIEAGGMTLEKIALDFRATIEAVKTIVSERASSKGLEFIASIDPQLPHFVFGDPTRLRQILINLLVNAVKFTEQGSVELRVAREESHIVFSVRDTGIGMDTAALSRLFKSFSQADDSVTRKYGGTGLGLMISKELIEAMGGSIEVESAPGVGTVFWFWLPLQEAQVAADNGTSAALSVSQAAIAGLVPGRVLLVDDNRVNQQLAGAMLDRLGLAHDFADNGADALRRLASADFALVLMDMEMPEMDGVTATRQIRAREAEQGTPRLPIIAMTANAMHEDRDRCFAAGMDGYISKPVSLTTLQNELRRLFADTGVVPVTSPAPTAATTAYDGTHGPIFDRAAAIAMMGDAELFEELATMYIADVPGYLRDLDAALAAADGDGLTRAAHTLKGLFATFAAAPGQTIAQRLEKSARDGNAAACTELVAAARTHAEALAGALKT